MVRKHLADKPTIYDIARQAGVSAKTVSRVLNNKPGVSEKTRSHILRLMQELNYHPHIGARALRGNRSGCIGVTVPAPINIVPVSQGFLIWLFNHLQRIFAHQGEYIAFDMNPYGDSKTGDYARGVWEHLYKACIIAGALRVNDTVIHRIHASGVPYLSFGRLDSLPECSSAVVDYEAGAYQSARFLIDRGHRHIGMLQGFADFQPGVERIRGYRRALDEAGIPFDERLIRSVAFGAKTIANVVHRVLADGKVTALIDSSATENASGLREGSRRAGRSPGQNFEIVAWTYASNAAVLREASAHLWLPVREVVFEGLELLAHWLYGEKEGPVRLVYQPILNQAPMTEEVPPPKRLFDLLE